MTLFQGSLVALITPFDRKGNLDVDALENLLAFHLEEGTDGIVCLGTTGEALTLFAKEREKVAEICIRAAKNKMAVLVGTGTASTQETIIFSEKAARLGADGALVVTPYYNKPTERGILAHFQEIAKVGLPLVLYHNPSRAGIRLSAEAISEIGKIPEMVAIKESSSDLSLVEKIKNLPILAGEDDLTLEILKKGGVGAISVVGNVIPRLWKEMIDLAREKKFLEALEIHEKCLPLVKSLFLETNPQGVKCALHFMGKCENILRLPLVPILPKYANSIISAVPGFALKEQ